MPRLLVLALSSLVFACTAGPDTGEHLLSDMAAAQDAEIADAGVTHDASTDGAAPDLTTPLAHFVYVSGSSGEIARYRLDLASGALTSAGTTSVGGNLSFLAIDAPRLRLYAVKEQGSGQVLSFTMDAATGALTSVNQVSSGGMGPAHVSVDASGQWVLVANYTDGKIAVLPVAGSGTLSASVDTRTAGSNAHQILVDASNAFVLVPCKGADYVAQYQFNSTTGALSANATPTVPTASGAGPRHLAFHPTLARAYVIGELDDTMTAYNFDVATGRLTSTQTLSTLPIGFGGANTTAEVFVHPSGKFLYGSNRGHDSIVIYRLDTAGAMTLVGHQATGGQTPRSFAIDPSGQYLLVANQTSNDVHVFAIDSQTGLLTAVGTPVSATGPSFVGVALLPGI